MTRVALMGRSKAATLALRVTSGRKRPAVVAFGRYLIELRGRRSRAAVARDLWNLHQVKCDASTLGHYEAGRVLSPDPVVLSGLAALYNSDVGRVIAVLKANREAHAEGRELSPPDMQAVLQRAGAGNAVASHLAETRRRLFQYAAEFAEFAERLAGAPAAAQATALCDRGQQSPPPESSV